NVSATAHSYWKPSSANTAKWPFITKLSWTSSTPTAENPLPSHLSCANIWKNGCPQPTPRDKNSNTRLTRTNIKVGKQLALRQQNIQRNYFGQKKSHPQSEWLSYI